LDEELFTFILDLEIHKATRLQYCVSVFCLTPDIPPHEIDAALLHRLVEVAVRQLRTTDVAASLAPSCVTFLLVDAEVRNLPKILQRLREELELHPFTVSGQVRHVTVRAGGGCYPQTATSGRELLQQAINLMTRAKQVEAAFCLPP
jgi:GGDEF domain-containing protein